MSSLICSRPGSPLSEELIFSLFLFFLTTLALADASVDSATVDEGVQLVSTSLMRSLSNSLSKAVLLNCLIRERDLTILQLSMTRDKSGSCLHSGSSI